MWEPSQADVDQLVDAALIAWALAVQIVTTLIVTISNGRHRRGL